MWMKELGLFEVCEKGLFSLFLCVFEESLCWG